jgi:alkyl sulfatase BDS1-like metallo-beta-lactamase superfamily hydrolase
MASVLPLRHVPSGFESGKVSDSGHHAHTNHLYGYGDPLRNSVDGQVTCDLGSAGSRGRDARTEKGKSGELLNIEKIV